MKLRTSLSGFSATFIAGLGLVPLAACGGATIGGSDENLQTGGAGGAPAGGGSPSTGGWPTFGGGFPSTGGVTQGTGGQWWGLAHCETLAPILGPSGEPTGFSTCNGTVTVRTFQSAQQDCPSSLPRNDTIVSPYDAGVAPACTRDSDCTAQAHGYCSLGDMGFPSFAACYYGCVADSECGVGQICLCGDPVGRCVPSTCPSTGGCTDFGMCASYTPNPGCPGVAFACTKPGDSCLTDADCASLGGGQCVAEFSPEIGPMRSCRPMSCVVGRPFLVEGEARLADINRRPDWTSSLVPHVDSLSVSGRATAAVRWTEIGLMEHASIAAFARFALELLSLGAPPSLVVATQDAMRDETVHARDAFALASGYAGAPVGPGRLSVDGSLTERTPLEILRTTILEGCIGETVAAVEAREALEYATDPAVREALGRVAVDEQRHAELAWRFVRWMLSEGPSDMRGAAREIFGRCIDEASRSTPAAGPHGDDSRALRAHGVLPASLRSEIRTQVLADVVAPCAKALFASAEQSDERAFLS